MDANTGTLGSIPAGAGEPQKAYADALNSRVYPRGCGGANLFSTGSKLAGGLSPRVRGSLRQAAHPIEVRGSIPAGAGEPARANECFGRAWVYPRGCGGAHRRCCARLSPWGLSPRVRGSRRPCRSSWCRRGSIPAGAGEPATKSPPRASSRVYPRGCGGAQRSAEGVRRDVGLSPRVRGSPDCGGRQQVGQGSIPAGAGEPLGKQPKPGTIRVYPRGCGGAS